MREFDARPRRYTSRISRESRFANFSGHHPYRSLNMRIAIPIARSSIIGLNRRKFMDAALPHIDSSLRRNEKRKAGRKREERTGREDRVKEIESERKKRKGGVERGKERERKGDKARRARSNSSYSHILCSEATSKVYVKLTVVPRAHCGMPED